MQLHGVRKDYRNIASLKAANYRNAFIYEFFSSLVTFGLFGIFFGGCLSLLLDAFGTPRILVWIFYAGFMLFSTAYGIRSGLSLGRHSANYQDTHGPLSEAEGIARIYYTPVALIPRLNGTTPPFTIAGPPQFIDAVQRLVSEARELAPHRYREALEFFPHAFYTPERRHEFAGRSDGLFSIDGSDYEFFRWVFWHEVGHCVCYHNNHDLSQESANAYADTVVRELD